MHCASMLGDKMGGKGGGGRGERQRKRERNLVTLIVRVGRQRKLRIKLPVG